MKVLHIGYSDKLGGAAIAMMRLHSSLRSIGLDSNVLVGEKLTEDKYVIGPKTYREKLFNEFKIKIARQKKYFYGHNGKYSHSLNLLGGNLLSKINNINPDIINLHWINNELISIKEISKLKIPIVWTFNDMWPMCGGEHYSEDDRNKLGYDKVQKRPDEKGFDINKFIWKQKKKYWKINIKHIVCISNWLKIKAKNSDLFKEKLISFVPCALNTQDWTPVNKNVARERLNLPKNKLILLFMSTNGDNDLRKGYKYINFFFENFLEFKKKVVLLKIGKNFKNENQNQNQSEYVININKSFNGDPKILKLYYSASDILLAPSVLEAFGQVAIEAGSCGVPTIGFKNTGLEDTIQHEKTGYICEHLSQNDFNIGLQWMIKKIEKDSKYFDSSCINFVKNNFSSEIIAQKYKKIYESILLK